MKEEEVEQIDALESREFWKSVRRLPQWYQVLSIILVGGLFVLDEKNTVLAAVVQKLHFSFGTTLLWPQAYQDMLLDTTLLERLGFTAYAAVLVAIIVSFVKAGEWIQGWCLKERVKANVSPDITPQRRAFSPATSGLNGGRQDSPGSSKTELRPVPLTDNELLAVTTLMPDVLRPTASGAETDLNASRSDESGPSPHSTGSQGKIVNALLWVSAIAEAASLLGEQVPHHLSKLDAGENSGSTLLDSLKAKGHWAAQERVLYTALWCILRIVGPCAMAAWYRLYHDLRNRHLVSLRWSLASVLAFRTGLSCLEMIWDSCTSSDDALPVLLGAHTANDLLGGWSTSFCVCALRWFAIVAMSNHVYGRHQRRGHIELRSNTSAIVFGTLGNITRLCLWESTTVLIVLAAMVGVHVIELLTLWLGVFLFAVWLPASIDSCSTDFFTVVGVVLSGVLCLSHGGSHASVLSLLSMSLRVVCLSYLVLSNVALLFRSCRWTLGSRRRAVVAVMLPFLVLVGVGLAWGHPVRLFLRFLADNTTEVGSDQGELSLDATELNVQMVAKRWLFQGVTLLIGDPGALVSHYRRFAHGLSIPKARPLGVAPTSVEDMPSSFVAYVLSEPAVKAQNRAILLLSWSLLIFLGILPTLSSIGQLIRRNPMKKKNGPPAVSGESEDPPRRRQVAFEPESPVHRRAATFGDRNISMGARNSGRRGPRQSDSPTEDGTEDGSNFPVSPSGFFYNADEFTPIFIERTLHSVVIVFTLFLSWCLGFGAAFALVPPDWMALFRVPIMGLAFFVSGIVAGILMDSKPILFGHVLRMVGLRDFPIGSDRGN